MRGDDPRRDAPSGRSGPPAPAAPRAAPQGRRDGEPSGSNGCSEKWSNVDRHQRQSRPQERFVGRPAGRRPAAPASSWTMTKKARSRRPPVRHDTHAQPPALAPLLEARGRQRDDRRHEQTWSRRKSSGDARATQSGPAELRRHAAGANRDQRAERPTTPTARAPTSSTAMASVSATWPADACAAADASRAADR